MLNIPSIAAVLSTMVFQTVAVAQPDIDRPETEPDRCGAIDWLDYSSAAPGFDCHEIATADEVYMAVVVGTVAGEPYPYAMLLNLPDHGWRLSAYGYNAAPVGEGDDFSWTVSRHGYATTLSPETVAPFLRTIESGAYDGVPEVGMYAASDTPGEEIICLDGSTLNITIKSKAGVTTGRRHSCAGRTLLDEFAEDLAALVIEADPVMERYLNVLSQDADDRD